MSGPLVDKQQKRGENVENIKSSLDTQLNFMFSTLSPVVNHLEGQTSQAIFLLSTSKFEVSLRF